MTTTITNSATNETITFLSNTPDFLVFEDYLDANQKGVPPHFHAQQTEKFTVLEGIFHVIVNGKSKTLAIGESILIPAGVPHSFHTLNSSRVKLRVELSPALDYETMFRSMAQAAQANRSVALQMALLRQELNLGFYLTTMPPHIQDFIFPIMAGIARILGYKTVYANHQ